MSYVGINIFSVVLGGIPSGYDVELSCRLTSSGERLPLFFHIRCRSKLHDGSSTFWIYGALRALFPDKQSTPHLEQPFSLAKLIHSCGLFPSGSILHRSRFPWQPHRTLPMCPDRLCFPDPYKSSSVPAVQGICFHVVTMRGGYHSNAARRHFRATQSPDTPSIPAGVLPWQHPGPEAAKAATNSRLLSALYSPTQYSPFATAQNLIQVDHQHHQP